MWQRCVQPELLDGLAETDPSAEHSRRDLQRVHGFMRTRTRLVRALRQLPVPSRPLRILELGAGDGTLLLGVARELVHDWPPVELTLLDRLDLVDETTVTQYARYRWSARPRVVDVLDWACATRCASHDASRWDVVIANLFLHHFDGPELTAVLEAIALSTDVMIACEPRRGWGALAGSHLVGVLGANAVTRADAVLSVRAGFRERELTALWPGKAGWSIEERASGAFSHLFRAARRPMQ